MSSDFTQLVDLAAERLGGAALLANDEFFAPREALLRPHEPEWREGEYTDRGKWMDGWETRRRRTPGHDWCIIRLGLPGVVRGLDVYTRFFRGNFPERCSVEAASVAGVPDPAALAEDASLWTEILPSSPLAGDSHNLFAIDHPHRVTHLRLNIFPDGGVARLRVHGEAVPDWDALRRRGGEVDLAAAENGGAVVSCSDMFFGHRHNMIMPGRAVNMGDGWETKRRRGPGHDWSIVRLGAPGTVRRIELDTDHFKGNAPGACWLEAANVAPGASPDDAAWVPLLDRTPLQPHARHAWEAEVLPAGVATHVRLSIHPDGGVARLRLFGALAG